MAIFFQQKHIRDRVEQQLQELRHAEMLQDRSEISDKSSGQINLPVCHDSGDSRANYSRVDTGVVNDGDGFVNLEGIMIKRDADGQTYYQVDWESPIDIQNPRNWTTCYRLGTLVLLDLVAAVVTASSAIDSAVALQVTQAFGISRTAEAFGGTGSFLIGLGLGSLLAAPASEFLGRYFVYLSALSLSACWLVGAALAPNIGAQVVFRFFAGFCGSAPLTVAGGSMSDLWTAREMTWAFPIFAIVGFGGPVAAPLIASYIGQSRSLSWRWAEWLMLISTGATIMMILMLMKETLGTKILQSKAAHFRKVTGNRRFLTSYEAERREEPGMRKFLIRNFTRPFVFAAEPIIGFFTIYTSVVYTILFTFLMGYTEIFEKTYGITQGLNNICFAGLLLGVVLLIIPLPLVWNVTKRQLRADNDDGTGKTIRQELRIIFAMIGAPIIPIGLFWMGWTDYTEIPLWSALTASVLVGFGTVCVFTSAYTYIIDSYQVYAASALTFVTLFRYVAAGAMTVASIPLYTSLGKHWTLTLLAVIALVIAPLPYILFWWGPKIRARSKHAVH